MPGIKINAVVETRATPHLRGGIIASAGKNKWRVCFVGNDGIEIELEKTSRQLRLVADDDQPNEGSGKVGNDDKGDTSKTKEDTVLVQTKQTYKYLSITALEFGNRLRPITASAVGLKCFM